MSLSSHSPMTGQALLDPAQTAACLPWLALAEEIARLLQEDGVQVPARTVQPLPAGASLFVMPASDGKVAMTKLITLTPANAGTARPTIQGDVVVFDVETGERRFLLDGPTVTARRTAAVSLLAAQRLAPNPQGPLLIIGAGVQGLAHLQAFVEGLGVREVQVASRNPASAQALVQAARALGVEARVAINADLAAQECPLIVTCTPARSVVLHTATRPDSFIAAVGAFTPSMAELSPALCQHFARRGQVIVDTPDATHEAGDLLQAGLDVASFKTLGDIVNQDTQRPTGPVLFKSCGWAGWDLAAARLALRARP